MSSVGYAAMTASHALFETDLEEAKKEIFTSLGDYRKLEVFGDLVAIAVFCRSPETKGGLLVGNATQLEDVWQGKTGLILKIGPDAFVEVPKTYNGRHPALGDWVYHDINMQAIQFSFAGKGWKRMLDTGRNPEPLRKWLGWPVRVIQSRYIIGRVDRPDSIL